MAEEHNDRDVQWVKLFGTTILLQVEEPADEKRGDKDEATLHKKPEKIVPCPRCKSVETKFCYFNNYNVNQPRHFCKGCQRYWTAGGALRNVPIGAGRRKPKPPNCRGVIDGFSEKCRYDASGIQQFGLAPELVVKEWQLVVSQGSFRHHYPVKRRRNS